MRSRMPLAGIVNKGSVSYLGDSPPLTGAALQGCWSPLLQRVFNDKSSGYCSRAHTRGFCPSLLVSESQTGLG